MTTLSDKMTELANAFRDVFGITDKLGIDSMIGLMVGHSSKNLLDKPASITGPGYNIEIPVDILPMKYWDKDIKVNVQGTSDTNGFVFNLWSNTSPAQRVTANPSFSVDVDSHAVNGNFHLYFSTGRTGSITITSVKILGGIVKALLSRSRLIRLNHISKLFKVINVEQSKPDWISGRAFCCIIKGSLLIIGA